MNVPDTTSVIQDALSKCCLSGVNVRRNTNVPLGHEPLVVLIRQWVLDNLWRFFMGGLFLESSCRRCVPPLPSRGDRLEP